MKTTILAHQRQILLAEACGWTNVEARYPKSHIGPCIEGNVPKVGGQAWTSTRHLIPNYFKDLNAMQEAKRALLTTFELCNTFQGFMLSERPHPHVFQTDKWTWGQSAEIEAISLLKTLDLWTED